MILEKSAVMGGCGDRVEDQKKKPQRMSFNCAAVLPVLASCDHLRTRMGAIFYSSYPPKPGLVRAGFAAKAAFT